MRLVTLCFLVALGAVVGCGDVNTGPIGTGGRGGDAGAGGIAGSDGVPPTKQSSYLLSCTIATLTLEMPIELSFELDRPYTEGGSADLTFSASLTLEEQAVTTLIQIIGDGVPEIDIISLEIATWVLGATPSSVETSFAAAPIHDFDLEVDPDEVQNLAMDRRKNADLLVAMNEKLNQTIESEVGEDRGQMLPGGTDAKWILDPSISRLRM